MTGCFFDDAPTCVCFLAAWQSVFIRTHEAMHDRSLISYLQVFHDAEHNLVQTGSLRETHTHTRLGISITNDWKDMMTNSDALQGQKYTNGVGAVPRGMTAAASDVCSLQMASCTLSAGSSLSTRGAPGHRFCGGRARIWCLVCFPKSFQICQYLHALPD